MPVGAAVPEAFTRYAYRNWAGLGGKNGNGVTIPAAELHRWIINRWKNESLEWQAGSHRGNRRCRGAGNGNGTAELILKQKSLDRAEERLKVLKGQSPFNASDPRRAEMAKLKDHRATLIAELGHPA